jgi:hypothetical protein
MEWLVVVIFANMMDGVYVFTDPVFETRTECMATLTDEEYIKKYTAKLVLEFGRPLPIQAVNCLQADEIQRILESVFTENPEEIEI